MSGEQPFEKVQPGTVDHAAVKRLIDEYPWSYHDVEVSGRTKRHYALTVSRNSVATPASGGQPAILFLKIEKHVGETPAVVIGLANALFTSAIFDGAEIYLSLDGNAPQAFHVEPDPSDHAQSLIVSDPSAMIRAIRSAAFAQLTVPIKGVGLASFDFKFEGLRWEA